MNDEQTLKAKWESYDTHVLPANASETQRVETRRAFYAGAQAMFGLIQTLGEDSADDLNEPTDAEIDQIEGWEKELQGFVEQIRAGEA